MEAVDAWIEEPEILKTLMPVEDVFSLLVVEL
jgi:translation elongation factor EF-Tu-like GTPase